jgi:hypothetical protein
MDLVLLEELGREISRLRSRYESLTRESPGTQALVSDWAAGARDLNWFVHLENIAECDVDVEFDREVLIVRATRAWPAPVVLVGLLPVPHGFDGEHPVIRFTEETLEIRIRPVPRGTP